MGKQHEEHHIIIGVIGNEEGEDHNFQGVIGKREESSKIRGVTQNRSIRWKTEEISEINKENITASEESSQHHSIKN